MEANFEVEPIGQSWWYSLLLIHTSSSPRISALSYTLTLIRLGQVWLGTTRILEKGSAPFVKTDLALPTYVSVPPYI
jgi:hypothetical protein